MESPDSPGGFSDPVVVAVGGAFEVEFAAVFGSVVVSAAGAEVGVDGVPAGGLSWLVGGDVVDVGEVRGLNHPGFAGDSVSWEGWGHVEKIWELPERAAGPCCSDGGGGSVGACFGVGGH